MENFEKQNQAIVKKLDDTQSETFAYNGIVFKKLNKNLNDKENERKKSLQIKNFLKLSRKYKRLFKMKKINSLKIIKSPPKMTNTPSPIKNKVHAYISKVETENRKDLAPFAAIKDSLDREYDRGKTKKIRKKKKQKRRLNFHKVYLKKNPKILVK